MDRLPQKEISMSMRRYFIRTVIVCLVSGFAFAQALAQTTAPSNLTITAAAAGERVRITAPASIVQLHVEVYAAGGERVFDQEIRGGNVFDWHLQDGRAERLAAGTYACVVTAKSVSGRLTQRVGTIDIADKSASVRAADSASLSVQQTLAIGPLEESSSLTIAGEDNPQTPAVIAHDGNEAQMIRGRGALTFRVGDFFKGLDTEQMRLTETGDLGIGTSAPQAKLDVAGAIRAERFLMARPKLTTSDKNVEATQTTAATDPVQPLVGGSGTTNQLTKWADGALGMVSDSMITEASGRIGIGTSTPETKLQVKGGDISVDAEQGLRLAGDPGSSIIAYRSDLPGITVGSGTPTDQLSLNSGGGERMRFDTKGNVGIGTSSPLTRLQVSGGDISLDADQALRRAGVPGNSIIGYRSDLPGITVGSGTPTDQLTFNAGGGERMRIDTSGKVGIGTNSPTSPLTVAGTVESTTGGFKFPDGTVQTTAGGSSSLYVKKAGDTMTGTLTLPAIKFPDGTTQTTAGGGTSDNYVLKAGDTMTGGLFLPKIGVGINQWMDATGSITSIQAKLQVKGGAVVTGQLYANSSPGAGEAAFFESIGPGMRARAYGPAGDSVAITAVSENDKIIVGRGKSNQTKFFFANDGTLNETADVYVSTPGKGLILKATDGANCFRVTVNNAGVLATAAVTCPQ
jgi:hypothetical protein